MQKVFPPIFSTLSKKSLPEGKIYHAFFLYRTVSPDKDWVKYIVSRLESSQQGFRCAYHERDFVAGKYIIENFTTILRQSLKVVIVLSPEFLKSEWTKYETDIASMMSIETSGQLVVIPVMLQECNIPDQLKNLTYLDVADREDIWLPRFLQVLQYENPEIAASSSNDVDQFSTLRVQRFQCRSSTDDYPSWAICTVFTSSGNIMITDMRNNKLKLFNLQGELIGETKCKSRPHSVAYLNSKIFIVTFPDETVARILTLDGNNFRVIKHISMPYQCAGVARIDKNVFAVACRSEKSIIVMNIIGEQLLSICPIFDENRIGIDDNDLRPHDSDEEFADATFSSSNSSKKGRKNFEFLKLQRMKSQEDKSLFIFPNFVCSLGMEKFYLTDYSTKCLTIIQNHDGAYEYRTICLTDPRGMIILGKNLLVADSKIRQLSLDGEHLDDLTLHGGNLSCPRCFAVDYTGKYIAITHKGDGDDCVTIYQILPSQNSTTRQYTGTYHNTLRMFPINTLTEVVLFAIILVFIAIFSFTISSDIKFIIAVTLVQDFIIYISYDKRDDTFAIIKCNLKLIMPVIDLIDSSGESLTVAEVNGRYVFNFPGVDEILPTIPAWKTRDDDIFLCNYPKSGTGWLSEMIAELVLGKPGLVQNSPVRTTMINEETFCQMPSPRIITTHTRFYELPEEIRQGKGRIIFLLRNPKDIMVSFFHHHRAARGYGYNGKWSNYIFRFINGQVDFGSWFDYMLEWNEALKTNKKLNIHLVHYEDLKKDGVEEIRKITDFLKIPRDMELCKSINEACIFENMQPIKQEIEKVKYKDVFTSKDSTFYRKGTVGDWKNWFSVAENEYFEKVYAEKMKDSDMSFIYTIT